MKRIPLYLLVLSFTSLTVAQETNGVARIEEPALWTLERCHREFCGEDVWEPFNRTMFAVFDWCMEHAVDPFCSVYSSIIPKPLIRGIDNFSENLEYPVRFVSDLGCAEWGAAWDDTRRFLVNTTLGVGGLFGPAEDWFYLFDSNASLSDAFAHWGVPAGPPLALPFLPRASVRAHVGYILDYAFDLKTWFDIFVPSGIPLLGYSWALTPNKAPVWRGSWESLAYHADDAYSTYMPLAAATSDFNFRQYAWHYYQDSYDCASLRLQAKGLPEGSAEQKDLLGEAEAKLEDVRPPVRKPTPKPVNLKGRWRTIPGYAPRSPALDSMRSLVFTPVNDDDFWWERRSIFNSDFSKSIDEREIEIEPGLPEAEYSFVAAPKGEGGSSAREKLVFVLPGIGTGRTGNDAVAMAEIVHQAGYAVVIIDSIFHWEYVRSANRGILPGYLTEDRKRLAEFMSRILDDLRADGCIATPEISCIGWSMGGLSVVHLANLAERGELPFDVRRLVSINPPASMEHALEPFDSVIARARSWSAEDAYQMFVRVAPSFYGWAAQDHPRYDPEDRPADAIGDPWDYAPNMTDEQAQYLMAMTLNRVCPTLIEQRHREHPFPWIKSELTWSRRRDFRREIGSVLLREYVSRYLPTCYEGVPLADMIATVDIRSLDSTLRGSKRLRMIHTRTDPLQTPGDRDYLDEALGDRITWFDEGAHCGYFYTTPFRDELLIRLAE
ncbi:MAG: VacJ family lipoprotein [bacterium]|nr:VacJ family lipoprotein [Candidatus Colisoma equi]